MKKKLYLKKLKIAQLNSGYRINGGQMGTFQCSDECYTFATCPNTINDNTCYDTCGLTTLTKTATEWSNDNCDPPTLDNACTLVG